MSNKNVEKVSDEVKDLLEKREQVFAKLGTAEGNVAKYRTELANLRSKLIKAHPELALRVIVADSW